MKRILLAAGLGLGILTVATAGTTNATASHNQMKNDTVPQDTTPTTPTPDTAHFSINQ